MEDIMKRGFTLAEVLITLGVIGVVSAMTLPSLINSIKDKHYHTALKRAIQFCSNQYLI